MRNWLVFNRSPWAFILLTLFFNALKQLYMIYTLTCHFYCLFKKRVNISWTIFIRYWLLIILMFVCINYFFIWKYANSNLQINNEIAVFYGEIPMFYAVFNNEKKHRREPSVLINHPHFLPFLFVFHKHKTTSIENLTSTSTLIC
jgi:small neutral amino acid transporter SnatA (MarC family)